MSKFIALFPGQGSQKVGMGKDLIQDEGGGRQFAADLSRKFFDQADAALGFKLSSICFEGPEDRLTMTEVAQPAILTVSVICFEIFKRCINDNSNGSKTLEITCALGHSLGEYSALVAAEALSFGDAVQLVHKRGRYMQEAVPAGAGKMAAVLAKDLDEINAVLAQASQDQPSLTVEVANINAPGQIVIAGSRAVVDQAIALMAGAKIVELPVSAPFHCRLMQPAADNLAKDIAALNLRNPIFPVLSNVTARAHQSIDEIRQNLIKQVCGTVRWVDCMRHALAEYPSDAVVEFGFGNVLSGLLKRIDSGAKRFNVSTAESASKLAESF